MSTNCRRLLVGLFRLRLLFVLATEHTLLRMFLNIWCQILFLGSLHNAALQDFFAAECGTEPLIAHAFYNSQYA